MSLHIVKEKYDETLSTSTIYLPYLRLLFMAVLKTQLRQTTLIWLCETAQNPCLTHLPAILYIGHRTAACRAVLTAGDITHCTVQQDPYYEIHYIYRHIAKDAKYALTPWYAIFLNCRPLRHG